jgi:nucleoside-diphosphate-sugar epimerase
MSEILVTGGSGFIGSRLVDALRAEGHRVTILDLVVNPRFRDITVQGDVADPAAVGRAMAGASAVFNLAAQHRDDVRPISRYYETNVEGMRVLCRQMDRQGIRRMVFTSSVAVYGFDTDDCTEDGPKLPDNDYGRSKLQAEEALSEWQEADGRNVALVIRPCAVFGPGNRGNIYNLFAQVMSGRFLMVGSGRNRKSIAFVENVVDAILFLSRMDRSTTVNYADKPDMDMNELVATVCRAGGRSVPRVRLPRAAGMAVGGALDLAAWSLGRTFPLSRVRVHKFCANSVVNAERIRTLGFAARVPLAESVARTVREEFGR